jgi:hypothetical protein
VALTLAAYASSSALLPSPARLAYGWWLALAVRESIPLDSDEWFQSSTSGHPPFPGFPGATRRCLCESFSACLDPYPGGSRGACTRFFPQDNGLPDVRTRSAPSHIHTATSVWACFRGCNHSLMFRPADLLATPIAPTAAPLRTGQPWLLRPRLSRFVTSPSSGYANRPFRATDGKGTFTP